MWLNKHRENYIIGEVITEHKGFNLGFYFIKSDFKSYNIEYYDKIKLNNTAPNLVNITFANTDNALTEILAHAFDGATALTQILIPNTVNTIATYALANCTSLQTVVFESGNISLHNINEYTSLVKYVIVIKENINAYYIISI